VPSPCRTRSHHRCSAPGLHHFDGYPRPPAPEPHASRRPGQRRPPRLVPREPVATAPGAFQRGQQNQQRQQQQQQHSNSQPSLHFASNNAAVLTGASMLHPHGGSGHGATAVANLLAPSEDSRPISTQRSASFVTASPSGQRPGHMHGAQSPSRSPFFVASPRTPAHATNISAQQNEGTPTMLGPSPSFVTTGFGPGSAALPVGPAVVPGYRTPPAPQKRAARCAQQHPEQQQPLCHSPSWRATPQPSTAVQQPQHPMCHSPSWRAPPQPSPAENMPPLLHGIASSMTPSLPPPSLALNGGGLPPALPAPPNGIPRSLTWMPPPEALMHQQHQLRHEQSYVPPLELPGKARVQSFSWAPPATDMVAGFFPAKPSFSWVPPAVEGTRQPSLSWIPPPATAAADCSELRFVSAWASKQHPAKASSGIVNADAVMETTMHLGICDGVSGVAHLGIPPDELPRDLLTCCREKLLSCSGRPTNTDDGTWLTGLIERAFDSTQAYGATTLLLATLRGSNLVTASLGDCALLVLRPCSLWPFRLRQIFKTAPGRYDTRRPVQVQRLHGFSDANAHTVIQGAMVSTTPVQHGDLLIIGSDGLFDNLQDDDVQHAVEDCCMAALGPPGSPPIVPSPAQLRHVAATIVDLAIANVRLDQPDDAQCLPWSGHGGDVPANNPDDTTALVATVIQPPTPQPSDDEPLESCAGVIDLSRLDVPSNVLRDRTNLHATPDTDLHVHQELKRSCNGTAMPSRVAGQHRQFHPQCDIRQWEMRNEDCVVA